MSAVLPTGHKVTSPFEQLINPAPPRVAPPDKDLVVLERRSGRAQQHAEDAAETSVRKTRSDSGCTRELMESVPAAVQTKGPVNAARHNATQNVPEHLLGFTPQRLQQLLDLESSLMQTLDQCPGAIRIRRHDGEDLQDSLKRTIIGLLAKVPDEVEPATESTQGRLAEQDAQAIDGFLSHLKAQAQILSRRGLKGWADKGRYNDATLTRELIDAVHAGEYAQVACRAMMLHTREAPGALLSDALDSAKKAYVNDLRESCGRVVPGNVAPLRGTINVSGDTIYCDEVPILRWCGRVLKSETLSWVAKTLDGERLVPINYASVYGDMRQSMLLLSHAIKGFESTRWGTESGQYKVWLNRLQDAFKRVEVDLLLDSYSRETRSVSTLRYHQYTPYVDRLLSSLRAVQLLECPDEISLSDWQSHVTPHVIRIDEALSDIDWIAI